jgi:hypothetical protein
MVFLPLFMAICAMAAWSATPQSATPPKKAASKNSTVKKQTDALDKKTAKELYMSGEFDQLLALLENVRRERHLRDRDDSVFIYKYLGVVYGADTTTRRKAESFLYQMLRLDPKQDLVDLEVGDAIQTMFRDVRKRYDRTTKDSLNLTNGATSPSESTSKRANDSLSGQASVNTTLQSATSGTSGQTPQSQGKAGATSNGFKDDKTLFWIAGGAAAVTLVGIATLLLMSPDTKTNTIETKVK